MGELRNFAIGIVLFSILTTIYVGSYVEFKEGYGLTEGDTKTLNVSGSVTTGSIATQLESLNLLEGIAGLQAGILKIAPPTGANVDILGGLASVGVGAVKTITGLVTTPVEIVGIVVTYYAGDVPGVLAQLVFGSVIVYILFVLLSAYLKKDV